MRRGGAAAISVLTEPTFFDGALDAPDGRTRSAVGVPLLRKDFVVDEYQLFEARAAGADAVLLIVAALEQAALSVCSRARAISASPRWSKCTTSMSCRAPADSGARVVGVNNRNLRTLAVDVEASYRLAALMPADVIAVSESGLQSRAEVGPSGCGRISAPS